jgi:hypothetical protein
LTGDAGCGCGDASCTPHSFGFNHTILDLFGHRAVFSAGQFLPACKKSKDQFIECRTAGVARFLND